MATRTPRTPHIGDRGQEILAALDLSPLTARQIMRLSALWEEPFRSLRRTFEYLQRLSALKLIRTFRYAAIHPGQPENYYVLARSGYELLHGPDARRPPRGRFSEIALSRQPHSRALADFIVQTLLLTAASGARLESFSRENAERLDLDEESLYPDAAFTLRASEDMYFRYFVEIDMGTERVRSRTSDESLERKLRFYDRLQDRIDERFRVLFLLTSRSNIRLAHLLSVAAALTRNPNRTLLCAAPLAAYLAIGSATAPVFYDHRRRLHGLMPNAAVTSLQSAPQLDAVAAF